MKRALISVALLALIGAPGAIAQSGGSAGAKNSGGGVPPAPVGHRQPKVADLPKNIDNPNDALSKENAMLDRKIKSICRGC